MQPDATGQLVVSSIAVWAMQGLKSAKWFTFFDANTKNRVLRLWSAVIAAFATLGITVTFNQEAGVLTVTGLTIASVSGFVWEWFKTFVLQEVIYRGAFKNGRNGGVS